MDREIKAVNYVIIHSFSGKLQIEMNVHYVCEEGSYICFGEVPMSSLVFNFYS
jgi:hypothetical protein